MPDSLSLRILNKREIEAMIENAMNTVTRMDKFLTGVGAWMDRNVIRTFKTSGASNGKRWPPLRRDTVYTRAGTSRIKYGTARKPKRTRSQLNVYRKTLGADVFRVGPMRGYEDHKRYRSPMDPPLTVSGGFRDSFGVLEKRFKSLRYGTKFPVELAQNIMRKRPVLVLTGRHRSELENMMANWVRSGLA